MRRGFLLVAPALLWPSTGCEHHFFKAEGSIVSAGGELGSWRTTPEGCARDPLDGLQPAQSKTVATFLWQDQRIVDHFRDTQRLKTANGPLRLEISRTGSGLSGNLQTMKPEAAAVLSQTNCTSFEMSTREGKSGISGGKPTLSGRLQLDCPVRGGRVTADVTFSGCEY